MDNEVYHKDENSSPAILKIIMIGKEVGSIIGRNGDIIKRFREESGAKINISSGSYTERIITITGTNESVAKAFSFICDKIEEFQSLQDNDVNLNQQSQSQRITIITVKVVIAAYQCGSLIGKGGSKIKAIRQASGATIQVASDMLPNSTERAVVVTGTKQAVLRCIHNICSTIQESSAKGFSIPYQPKSSIAPTQQMLIAAANQQAYEAYALPGLISANGVATAPTSAADIGTTIIPTAATQGRTSTLGVPYSLLVPQTLGVSPLAVFDPIFQNGHLPTAASAASFPHIYSPTISEIGRIGPPPFSNLTTLGIGNIATSAAPPNLNVAALAAMTNRVPDVLTQTYEMTVPNDLIGCVIGKGGNKIAEIRQISGATIRISNCEDRENAENVERTITITGNSESVLVAQYLINASLEQQKLNILRQNLSAATQITPASMTNCSIAGTSSTAINGPAGLTRSDLTSPAIIPANIPFIPAAAVGSSTEYLPIPAHLLSKPNLTYNNHNHNNHNINAIYNHNNSAGGAAIFTLAPNLNGTSFGNLQPASTSQFHPSLTTSALNPASSSAQQFLKQPASVTLKQQQQQQQTAQEKSSNAHRSNDVKFRPY